MARRSSRRWIGLCMTTSTWLLSAAFETQAADCSANYQFGAAQGDITGPIAEAALNGYGDLSHKSEGLHQRLRSRAFVIEAPCQKQMVALVSNDLAMIHHNLRREVLNQLEAKLPGQFSEENLMLSATHTHSAQGGYGHYILYNVTSLGYSPAAFQVIVDGTVEAIVRAFENRQAATLHVAQGEIKETIGWNRSLEAYGQNSESERRSYKQNVDNEVTVLTAVNAEGEVIASLNWHAVHPVSLPMDNRLISGDNKGLAAYFVERKMGSTYRHHKDFIAGFFQANSGDVSPYDFTKPFVDESDYWQRMEHSARVQADHVLQLMDEREASLSVELNMRHQFVDLHGYTLREEFTGDGLGETCLAALGVAFAAGTENGQPVDWFKEGTVWGVNWPKITLLPEEQKCHAEKVLLLPVGKVRGWVPHILPYQLITIGELAIIAAPFEATTMTGRRLKQLMRKSLADFGIRTVVFTGLANEYSHYVTTPEEYRAQNYEGGSTLFGPLSYAAHSQVFYDLAQALQNQVPVETGPQPPSLEHQKFQLQAGVVFDSSPRGKSFGDVIEETLPMYQQGDLVEIAFWGAHPKNDLKRGSSYLTVEMETAAGWEPKYFDWDHDTRLIWQRDGLANSKVLIRWRIDQQNPEGRYRICHSGQSKSLLGRFKSYHGCSEPFQVVASH
ncbi:MAG: neutral/alkaline non-lysosomal ceramidase N-terminal domain-containing protein [Oligoflexus sp.]